MLSQGNDGPSRPIFIIFNGGRTLSPPYRGSDGLRHLVVGPVGLRDQDDALVMLNMVGMLEDLGHTVIEAYSRKEALEILRREDYF